MIALFTEPSFVPFYRLFKKKAPGNTPSKYSGHYAVMRSIIIGMDEANIPYVFNPNILTMSYKNVHVFSNISALKIAIFLKRIGIIKHLSAGPNLVVSSADENGILSSKYIDKIVLNSEWTKMFYILENSAITPDKIVLWAAGVDVKYWDLGKRDHPKLNILFYIKNEEKELLKDCKEIAKKYNLTFSEIFYGKYKLKEFKEELMMADCVVYFSKSESQGIALAEIWATDIPTFVWNPGVFNYQSKSYECSSAPYLTEETGRFFKNPNEFDVIISEFASQKTTYKPREYTIKHFSDIVAAQDFVKKIT
jgi:glycosyltransferase involved in cell wall biosynthesis